MKTGLVLSGGAVRGAYQAGVIEGVIEVLGLGPSDVSPFCAFTGTSVGAINGAFLAAHADRGDLNIEGLRQLWTGLSIESDLRIDPWALLSLRRWRRHAELGGKPARTVMDGRRIESMVLEGIPFARLRRNIEEGVIDGIALAALDIHNGRTTLFVDHGADVVYRPSQDPRRAHSLGPIQARHVLASAAIPFLYPPQRVRDRAYFDGGLRFNTPVSPAIRLGMEQIFVISLSYFPTGEELEDRDATVNVSHPFFLFGKVLNALLLDPLPYDLQVLERFNRVLELLDRSLSSEEKDQFAEVVKRTRGARYRQIRTMMLSPTEDIGMLCGAYIRENLPRWRLPWVTRRLLSMAVDQGDASADLASYFLFDGGYAERLLDLGHRDAVARADEIRAMFEDRK